MPALFSYFFCIRNGIACVAAELNPGIVRTIPGFSSAATPANMEMYREFQTSSMVASS